MRPDCNLCLTTRQSTKAVVILLNLSGEINNDRIVATGLCKTEQILASQRGCGGVDQRMAIDFVVLQQSLIDRKGKRASPVIDNAEGGHCPGGNTEKLFHFFRIAERKPAGPAQKLVQGLQVDLGIFLRGEQEVVSLFILQEQVFGVAAFNLSTQFLAVFDGEKGWMFDCICFESAGIEIGKKGITTHGNSRQIGVEVRGILVGHSETRAGLDKVEDDTANGDCLARSGTYINACSPKGEFGAFFANIHLAKAQALAHIHRAEEIFSRSSGRSSGVEHNLAKVGVVSSNLIARSIFPKILAHCLSKTLIKQGFLCYVACIIEHGCT